MAFERYVISDGKKLRCGYTTGSSAAMAAGAACRLLLLGERVKAYEIQTPDGARVTAEIENLRMESGAAVCGVRKDGGDDCDATDGALVCARAEKIAAGVEIDGGPGVGRVTKPGLDQPVGAAAINSVPRRMIEAAVLDEYRRAGCSGGVRIVISVPGGEEIARKTFNPNLGIAGGISILGTSGIVRPMSLQALQDTIGVELRVAAAAGAREVIFTPGNYGEEFLAGMEGTKNIAHVGISNFFGAALDFAAESKFETVLIVSHFGKLVKLAGGIMNTHSSFADCRTELVTAHAALLGAPVPLLKALMDCPTTDGCVGLLRDANLLEPVMTSLLTKIQYHLDRRARGAFRVGAVTFSREYGFLGATPEGQKIWDEWKNR
jgi:cobalamin biosynthesis protein CbiD